jgi:hypothetical protein
MAVAVLSDGRRVISGSSDSTIRLWDVDTGAELHRFEGHTDIVRCLAVSRDSRWATSGSTDRTIRVWDLETGEQLCRLEGHTGAVLSLALSPDGELAVSGSSDCTLRLWNIEVPGRQASGEGQATGRAKAPRRRRDAPLMDQTKPPTAPITSGADGIFNYPAGFQTALAWVKAFCQARGEKNKQPTCFISYSWGDRQHEEWIERLADHLKNADVSVILDRWHNMPGTSINRFIERIEGADFVCPVGTPRYRRKDRVQQMDPVVQAELRLIKSKLRKRDSIRDTVIPLLCKGTAQTAFPPLLEDSVFIDFRRENEFFARLFELILTLHHIPFEDKMARKHRAALFEAENR